MFIKKKFQDKDLFSVHFMNTIEHMLGNHENCND